MGLGVACQNIFSAYLPDIDCSTQNSFSFFEDALPYKKLLQANRSDSLLRKGHSRCARNKTQHSCCSRRESLGRSVHHWLWWEACQVSKEFQRLYGMPFLQLTLPNTALLFGWNFDTLGKFSSSHNSPFPSLSI